MDGNQFRPLAQLNEPNYGDVSHFESGVENATMIIHDEDKSLGEFHTHPEHSFHSIEPIESSIIRHIGALGVE